MNPLTVTWSPQIYRYWMGKLNNFNQSGFDVIWEWPMEKQFRLCKDAMIEMGDPFQPFIYGQVLFPIKLQQI